VILPLILVFSIIVVSGNALMQYHPKSTMIEDVDDGIVDTAPTTDTTPTTTPDPTPTTIPTPLPDPIPTTDPTPTTDPIPDTMPVPTHEDHGKDKHKKK
jgi:hypothetical protein